MVPGWSGIHPQIFDLSLAILQWVWHSQSYDPGEVPGERSRLPPV